MKNIILILLLSFVVFSCSKDENNNEPKTNFPEHLIGKWKMVACRTEDDSSPEVDCSVQATKNIYDMWFKVDGNYLSKTYYSCNDELCKYTVKEREIEGYPNYFKIIFGRDGIECDYPCSNTVYIISTKKNELTLSFGDYYETETIIYTRVE